MGFFKKHQRNTSYDLFSSFEHYLPGLGGMLALLLMFFLGTILGNIVGSVLAFAVSVKFALTYGTLIVFPLQFMPAMIFASYQSRKNELFAWTDQGDPKPGIPLDNNNFGRLGGWWLAIIVSIATIAAAFITEPVTALLPDINNLGDDVPEFLQEFVKSINATLEEITKAPVWLTLLTVSVFAPFFEEWLCRGILLRGLLHKMKPCAAIMTSAAFFAILHMNPWQAIPAFILGSLFGYVYYKTGSLKLVMLMHCVNNTLTVILSKIPTLQNPEIKTFMDVMSPWAYACVYIACILIVFSAVFTLKGVPSEFRKES